MSSGMTIPQVKSALQNVAPKIINRTSAEEIEPYTTPRPLQSAALPTGAHDAVLRFAAILTGVVALVLITACANIAGLLLSRLANRDREIALRIALGAGRGRLARQLMTESMVLAVAGGVGAIVVFVVFMRAVQSVRLPGEITGEALNVVGDSNVLLFGILATLVAGLVVGLAPALHSSRTGTSSRLKGSGDIRGTLPNRLRSALVTAQVAVGLVLLVGTGLFARALNRALSVDAGFAMENVATVMVDPSLTRMPLDRAPAYYASVLQRVKAVPGVVDATWTGTLPLSQDSDRESVDVEGYTPPTGKQTSIETGYVGANYHKIIGIPLLRGRGFDERDTPSSQPVAIINETAAGRFFAKRNPIDASIRVGNKTFRIIAVARDIKYHSLNEEPRPYTYFALAQGAVTRVAAGRVLFRTSVKAETVFPSITAAASTADASVPVYDARTIKSNLDSILAPQLAGTWLLGAFSILALVVAAVGIYGIVALSVSQRTREIGVRMALGSSGRAVVALIVRRNMMFVAIGIPVGLAIATTLGKALNRFLYGIPAADVITLATTSILMVVVAAAASIIPARRAVKINPTDALRADV